jgi:hypothetical protein
MGYTANGLIGKSKDVNGGIFHQLFGAAPTLPVRYSDGNYGDPNDYHTGDGNNYNPQATLDFFNQKSKNMRFTYNVYGEVNFLKNFKFRIKLWRRYRPGRSKGIYTHLPGYLCAKKHSIKPGCKPYRNPQLDLGKYVNL